MSLKNNGSLTTRVKTSLTQPSNFSLAYANYDTIRQHHPTIAQLHALVTCHSLESGQGFESYRSYVSYNRLKLVHNKCLLISKNPAHAFRRFTFRRCPKRTILFWVLFKFLCLPSWPGICVLNDEIILAVMCEIYAIAEKKLEGKKSGLSQRDFNP